MLKLENLKPDLEQGKHIILTRDGGEYCIISPYKDCDGDYRCSCWYDNIEDASEYIGGTEGYSKETFEICSEEENYKFVDYYIPEYKMPKVGDEMYVLKDYEDFERGDLVKISYDNCRMGIQFVKIDYDYGYIPLSYLGYLNPIKKEKEDMYIMKNGKKVSKDTIEEALRDYFKTNE